jgi:transcriptional regulator with XRE-family HTH domain
VHRVTRSLAKTTLTAREALALNMIRLRRERDWSQELLGAEAGLHRTFIAHVERLVRNPSLDSIERIAGALDVQVWEILRPHS